MDVSGLKKLGVKPRNLHSPFHFIASKIFGCSFVAKAVMVKAHEDSDSKP
jgi:hypothetical protein